MAPALCRRLIYAGSRRLLPQSSMVDEYSIAIDCLMPLIFR